MQHFCWNHCICSKKTESPFLPQNKNTGNCDYLSQFFLKGKSAEIYYYYSMVGERELWDPNSKWLQKYNIYRSGTYNCEKKVKIMCSWYFFRIFRITNCEKKKSQLPFNLLIPRCKWLSIVNYSLKWKVIVVNTLHLTLNLIKVQWCIW